MKKLFAVLTAAAFGLTLGTAFADEAAFAPLSQRSAASPVIVATSKEEIKQMKKVEKKREHRERKREKLEKIREKQQRLKIKEKKVESSK